MFSVQALEFDLKMIKQSHHHKNISHAEACILGRKNQK
jgi:hypothetical protein